MSNMTFIPVDDDSECGASTERLVAAARETVDRVAARGRGTGDELRQRVAQLKVRAREQEARARAILASQVETAAGYVRRKPLVGLGIAFAAGVVVCGLLFRR